VRTLTADQAAAINPTGAVSFACPRLSPVAVGSQGAAARLQASAWRRAGKGRISARYFGSGLGSVLAAEVPGAVRRAAEQTDKRATSIVRENAYNTQQKQLHLMSRRDPRTWRPPV
jgi:hypothetical protein